MSHSSLCDGVYLAHPNNYTKGRNGYKICKFTPHMMAGILSAKACAVNIFQNPTRRASANYCIGNEGDLVCNVEEENRAWTSSSRTNDFQAITVEVSNCEYKGQWRISDKAWNTLVNLAVDVCRRYNFRLVYNGTPSGSLTRHNMFANTDCPGPYLQSRFYELQDTVNAILDGKEPPAPAPRPEPEPIQGIIAQIQSTLNSNYGLNIAVDNIFGKQTKKALVTALQTELNKQYNKNLKVDGIFGPLTKEACVSVRKGARGNITWILQALLYCRSYNPNGVDGIFGNGTKIAVEHYQHDKGLTQDGVAGRNTFESLCK